MDHFPSQKYTTIQKAMDFIKILEILADTKGPIIHLPIPRCIRLRLRPCVEEIHWLQIIIKDRGKGKKNLSRYHNKETV